MTPNRRRHRRALAGSVLASALAASPALAQPPASAPPAADRRPDVSGAAQAAPPGRYALEPALREGGAPLTVDEVVAGALAGAPSVEEARARARAAEAAVGEVRAALWPRLDVGFQYRRVDGFPDGVIEAGGGAQVEIAIPRDQTSLSARVTVPLTDELFRVLPTMRSAEARAAAERLEAEAAAADVRVSAEEAYWRWVEARAAAAVAEAGVAQAGEQRARVEALARSGYATEADVLEVRSREARAAALAARAQGALDVAARTLAVVARLPDGPEGRAVGDGLDDPPTPPPGPAAAGVARALDARPELRAIDRALAGQASQVDAAQGAALPRVSLFAGAQYANPNPNVIPPIAAWYESWELGVGVTWSPNDLAGGLHGADRARGDEAALRARRDALRDAVRLEVEAALADWRAADASAAAARARERAAHEAYAARAAQLAAGEAVVTEVLDADLELTEARLAAVRAAAGVRVAAARHRRAVGAE